MSYNVNRSFSSTTTCLRSIRALLAIGCAVAAACAPPPLWFSVADENTVRIFGPHAGTSLTLPNVSQLAWGRDGVSLYAVAGTEENTLYELRRDPATIVSRLPIGGGPASNIVIDARARTLYVGAGTHVHAFALAPLAPLYSVAACDKHVVSLTLFEPGTKAFAACESGALVEIDTDLIERQRVTPIPGCVPASLALNSSETLIVFPCRESGRIYLLDRVGLTVFDSIDGGPDLAGLMLESSRRRGVITRSDGQAAYLEISSGRVTDLNVPGPVVRAAQTANGSIALIIAGVPMQLAIFHVHGITLVSSISGMGAPSAFATWPTESPIMRFLPLYPSPPLDAAKP